MFDKEHNRIKSGVSWLTVNRVCNLRCKWCYAEGTNYRPKEMSLELAKKLTILTKKMGVDGIILIGGEPTLWKRLFKYNCFCKETGIRSALVTNAIKFGEDKFWEKYQEFPNDNIGLSLKARNPKHLEEVAQSTAFEQMKKVMKRACTCFNCQVSITYSSFYCGNLLDMAQFAIDCGSNGVKINFCSTTFTNNKPDSTYMVSPQELAFNVQRDYTRLTEITNDRLVFEMMLPFCLFSKEFIEKLKEKGQIVSVCQLKKGNGLIWDECGNILICNALFDYPIGHYGTDFTNPESLERWFNSETVLDYYNRMGAYPSNLCQSCVMYQDCGGGCPLRWAVYNPKEIVKPFKN